MKNLYKIGMACMAIFLIIGFRGHTQNNITDYQYWFDSDFNNQIYSTVTPAENLDLNLAIPLTTVSDGLHTFNIRFRDGNERWSIVSSTYFYYTDLNNNTITAYQYWFDADISSNTFVSTNPTQDFLLTDMISLENIEDGLHLFSIRFKDNKGKWSVPIDHYIFKTHQLIDNNIVAYRYWIDNDFENAIYESVSSPTEVLELNEDISFPGLDIGDYTIHFQFKDSSDNWSLVTSDDFSLTTLSVIENTFGKAISAYPNPTKGNVHIDLAGSYKIIEVQVINNLGELINQYLFNNKNSIDLSLNKLSNGIYHIKVKSDTKHATLKLIKY